MKRKNLTKLTLTLASVMAASTIGGIVAATTTTEAAEAKAYALTDVFSAKNATIDKNTDNITSFALSNDGSVYIKRDLAFKWYASETASYFSTSFTFADANFDSVSLAMETPSAWATKDDKAQNVISFEKTATGFDVFVNKSKETGATNVAATSYVGTDYVGKPIVIALDDIGCDDGQYNVSVSVNGVAQTMNTTDVVSRFVNVGQTYAEYSLNKMHPLTFLAEVSATDDPATTEKEDQTVVLLNDINGQKFNEISSDNKVKDTAPAVLVLGEEVSAFQLGTAFNLNYDYLDVLSKNITITREYYQYNPAHEEVKYNTLNTSVIFQETTIEKTETAPATTVFKEKGCEFVSIKFTLSDGTFAEDNNDNGLKKAVYDLAWYANADSVVKSTDADAPKVNATNPETIDYIKVVRNQEAPKYKHLTANETTLENDKEAAYYNGEELIAATAFQDKVTKAAENCYAGGDALNLESLEKLISDNNGYRNMKFTISYYKPSTAADSPESLTDRSYNSMEISVPEEGYYQFKIFAKDKAGNQMKYYIDGELVTVNATNVWDIEEIPFFSFYIKSGKLSVEEDTGLTVRKDTEVLDTKYTFDSFEVENAGSLKETYALYKLKVSEFNALNVQKGLTDITYETLTQKIQAEFASAQSWAELLDGRTYNEFYLDTYCELLANNDAALAAQIYDCFEAVGVKGDRVNNATDRWETHEWDPTARSFTTVETGTYLLVADFYESNKPTERVAAYKVLEISDKVDEILGRNEWLKNNVVSVILFAVAGVMLILIVVLLLVKPSDETLEDVAAKKENEKGKAKKN